QFGQMWIVRLEGQRARADDLSRFNDVAKLGVQPREQLVSRFLIETNDELSADVAHAVVHAVKPQDLSNGPFYGIEAAKQRHIGGGKKLSGRGAVCDGNSPIVPRS